MYCSHALFRVLPRRYPAPPIPSLLSQQPSDLHAPCPCPLTVGPGPQLPHRCRPPDSGLLIKYPLPLPNPQFGQGRNYIIAATDAASLAVCMKHRLPCLNASHVLGEQGGVLSNTTMPINSKECESVFERLCKCGESVEIGDVCEDGYICGFQSPAMYCMPNEYSLGPAPRALYDGVGNRNVGYIVSLPHLSSPGSLLCRSDDGVGQDRAPAENPGPEVPRALQRCGEGDEFDQRSRSGMDVGSPSALHAAC